MMNKVQSGIDVVLFVNDAPVAGQQNASLNRSMTSINITNQIDANWQESIGGIKSWNISCDGMYVKNSKGFMALEEAFMNNTEIKVQIVLNNQKYEGQGLIINFPMSAMYNSQFKYTIKILGTGELNKVIK